MAGKTYGYARVSSKEQSLNRQLDALEEFGVRKSRLYYDKASGKDFERPQWQRLVRRLKCFAWLESRGIERIRVWCGVSLGCRC